MKEYSHKEETNFKVLTKFISTNYLNRVTTLKELKLKSFTQDCSWEAGQLAPETQKSPHGEYLGTCPQNPP